MAATRTTSGRVRAGVTASLRAYLARRHPRLRLDDHLHAVGLDPAVLGQRDAWLDQAQWVTLLDVVAAAADDARLGIDYASQLPWPDLGVLGYVLLHSPTVAHALGNSARYLAVQQTGGVLTLEAGPRTARYRYAMRDPRITRYDQNAEGVFAVAVRLIRERTGAAGWAPEQVHFRHTGPADARGHATFFAAPVRFGQRDNVLVLATADLARPLPAADAGLLPLLLRHADDTLARLPATDDDGDHVRRAIVAAISAGDASIDGVATRLGVSARSLQRQLAGDGRTFKALIDEVRLGLAQRYLADPALTLTEAAYLLGYSELSAFSRAFRRWTGASALAFRRQHAA